MVYSGSPGAAGRPGQWPARTFSDKDVAGLCITREGECGEHDGQMGFDAVAEARSTTLLRTRTYGKQLAMLLPAQLENS